MPSPPRPRPLTKVHDLVDTRLAQKISQVAGVGLVSLEGGQKPGVRIRANPTALAAYGLNIDDLRTTITNANVNTPKGNFDGPARAYTINANDQITDPSIFRDVIVAYRNGAPVRLRDVATVEEGQENNRIAAWVNGTPAVIVNVQRQPGANVIEVVDRIKALLPQLRDSLPVALDVAIVTDRTLTIRASVRDVQIELTFAVVLVVAVIFAFLGDARATVIPSLSVPLSLVGTLAVMYLAGFSLNNLSIMALTIATGFVVDDAIVMIENIARYIERGDDPKTAALKGSRQIAFTVVSLTVSLIAVLIPLLFMADVVGRLFSEFAVTLSVTILISGPGVAHPGADDVRPSSEAAPGRSGRRVWRRAAGRASRRGPGIGRALVHPADRPLRPLADRGVPPPDAHAPGRGRHGRVDGRCSTSWCPRASSRSRTTA